MTGKERAGFGAAIGHLANAYEALSIARIVELEDDTRRLRGISHWARRRSMREYFNAFVAMVFGHSEDRNRAADQIARCIEIANAALIADTLPLVDLATQINGVRLFDTPGVVAHLGRAAAAVERPER